MKFKNIYTQTKENVEMSLLSLWTPGRHRMRAAVKDLIKREPLMAEPIFQSIFPWEQTDDNNWRSYLHPDVVKLQDQKAQARGETYCPFSHQAKSWKELYDGNSIVVTSGTGSGKTECFMLPVLSDLCQRRNVPIQNTPVEAIFLYPLNALMQDQKERLGVDCQELGLRFAVYNSSLKERKASGAVNPHYPDSEVRTREKLRSYDTQAPSCPQILLTNPSMLEFMLVRDSDKPIFERSRGKLRWIVIDEAHSYTGSAAVELAYLIKRVLSAFDVSRDDVRIVCTSATIGDPKSPQQLVEFIETITGKYSSASSHKLVPIGGNRIVPTFDAATIQNALSSKGITTINAANILSLQRMVNERPLRLSEMWRLLTNKPYSVESALDLIDAICEVKIGKDFIMMLRGHFFMRAIDGIYACVSGHDHSLTTNKGNGRCPICGAPLFEVVQCRDCKEFLIVCEENSNHEIKASYSESVASSIDNEDDADYDDDFTDGGVRYSDQNWQKLYLAFYGRGRHYGKPHPDYEYSRIALSWDGKMMKSVSGQNGAWVLLENDDKNYCPSCACGSGSDGSRFSNFRLSANWINETIAPALLKEGATTTDEWGKYIAFTDSRQGTAIYAKRFNIDAERAYSRARLTSSLRVKAYDPTDDALIRRQMQRNQGMSYDSAADFLIANNLISPSSLPEFSIDKAADVIFNQQIFEHIDMEARNSGQPYRQKDEVAYKTALVRSNIARRPVHLPNMESLGLITLIYPAIQSITSLPRTWNKEGFSKDDYRAFLKICMDYVIRMGNHTQCPTQVEYQYLRDANSSTPYDSGTWPEVQKDKNGVTPKQHRLVLLLCAALGIKDTAALTPREQDINCLLNEAWGFLENNLLKKVDSNDLYYEINDQYDGRYYLDLSLSSSSCKVKAIEDAWLCPVTNYLLDTVFRGYSPAMKGCLCKENIDRFAVSADPDIHIPLIGSQTFVEDKRKLILEGVWNNRHKYAFVPTTQAYLTAEHSGQQNRELLDYYTNEFKSTPHKLNLLQCSTTMEMGVDIGDIETVLMTNIPPSSANYNQRTGRAGRRGQSKAVAFSLCPQTAIGMQAFENPMSILISVNPAIRPIVSDIIVQRHVNSFLVRSFLYDDQAPAVRFWKVHDWLKQSGVYDSFMTWTSAHRTDQQLLQEYHRIFGQKFKPLSSAIDAANQSLDDIAIEYQGILSDIEQAINSTTNQAKKDALTIQGNALMNLDLKGYLAEKQFLPNADMPTGVVEFNFMDSSQYRKLLSLKTQLDNLRQQLLAHGINGIQQSSIERQIAETQHEIDKLNEKNVTSREIKVGLSEYAPGQMVVIDERNYVSAGIEWRNSLGQQQPWKYLYHCPKCGRFEYSVDPTLKQCPKCGGTYEGVLNPNGTKMTYAIEPIRFRTDVNRGKNRKEGTEKTFYQIKTILTDVNWQSCVRGPMCDLVGSVGASSEIVFYNEGNGQGFNLCMDCGRMEVGGRTRTSSNWIHNKITEDAPCPVNNPYNGIVLSGKFPTSFVSLRFYKDASGQKYVDDVELLYSLGVLLTRSLAKEIGVSQDDIDFDVRGEDGYGSIFIYDTQKGGCGYSTRMTDPQTCNSVFARAKTMASSFSCQCENSVSGACVHCLIDRYSQRFENRLSKFKVMEWFAGQSMNTSQSLGGATAVPIPLQYLLTSLYSNRNTTSLTICVDAGEMNIDEWTRKDGTMGRILNECVRRGQVVKILIANIPNSKAQDMLPFVDIPSRFQPWGIPVEAIKTGTNSQGETTAIIVNNHDHYFTDETGVLPFNQDWGVKCSRLFEDNNIPSFTQTAFPTWADVYRLMLPNEITRPAIIKNPTTVVVGRFYSSVIAPNLLQQGDAQTIHGILNGKKVKVIFSDSYVNSALAALLLVYLIKEMRDIYKFDIQTVDLQFNGPKRRCDNLHWNGYTWITFNFPDVQMADDYVYDLFVSVLGITPNFSTIQPDHYRWLRFQPEGEDTYVEIRPDHGIGGGWVSNEQYKDLDYLDGTTQIQMKQDTDIVYYLLTKKK